MHDLLIRGGTVIDGTGAPPRAADVAIHGDRIVAIGRVDSAARRTIHADRAVVTPGFIDLHTHCDFTIHARPDAPSMVRQGVTTLVCGNCGFSSFPAPPARRRRVAEWAGFLSARDELVFEEVAGWFGALERLPLVPNLVTLVGHGTLRLAVGLEGGPAPEPAVERMEVLLDASLQAGAAGLSSGLIYEPGRDATAAELHRLASVAARRGTFYATHLRSESRDLVAAIGEAIDVARASGVGVHVSHLKAVSPGGLGLAAEALRRVDDAVRAGLDVTADQYPYTASSTKLGALLGVLGSSEEEASIAPLVIIADDPSGRYTGMTLQEVAHGLGLDPSAALSALIADGGDAIGILLMDRVAEDELRLVLARPDVAVASDGWTLAGSEGSNPHPRSFGTFARVLGHYARDRGVLSLAAAVRKMTSVPARRLGMRDRGLISEGAVADLVVLDPATVAGPASYEEPFRLAEGVSHVIVAGQLVIDGAEPTGEAPGRALRRTASGWTA
jgi:N-acyl-D-amino-acid deacylase